LQALRLVVLALKKKMSKNACRRSARKGCLLNSCLGSGSLPGRVGRGSSQGKQQHLNGSCLGSGSLPGRVGRQLSGQRQLAGESWARQQSGEAAAFERQQGAAATAEKSRLESEKELLREKDTLTKKRTTAAWTKDGVGISQYDLEQLPKEDQKNLQNKSYEEFKLLKQNAETSRLAATRTSEELYLVNPKTNEGLTHAEAASKSKEELKGFMPYAMWARANEQTAALAKAAAKIKEGAKITAADRKLAAEYEKDLITNFIDKGNEVPQHWMDLLNVLRTAAGWETVTNKTIKEKSFWTGTKETPSLGPGAAKGQQDIANAILDMAEGKAPSTQAMPSAPTAEPAAPVQEAAPPTKQGLLGSPITQYMPESTMKNQDRMQSVLTQINDELAKQGIQEADLMAVIQKYKEDPKYFPQTDAEKKAADIMARLAGPPYNFDLPISGDPVFRAAGQLDRRLGGPVGEILSGFGAIPGQLGEAAKSVGGLLQ